MSVDPLFEDYVMLTPYQFASNTPIQAIDLDGLEAVIPLPPPVIIPLMPPPSGNSQGVTPYHHLDGEFWGCGEIIKLLVKAYTPNWTKTPSVTKTDARDYTDIELSIKEMESLSDPNFKDWAALKEAERRRYAEGKNKTKKALDKNAKTNKIDGIPTLDHKGKLHGLLPDENQLKTYTKEELEHLLNDTEESIKKRKEVSQDFERKRLKLPNARKEDEKQKVPGHTKRILDELKLKKDIQKILEKKRK